MVSKLFQFLDPDVQSPKTKEILGNKENRKYINKNINIERANKGEQKGPFKFRNNWFFIFTGREFGSIDFITIDVLVIQPTGHLSIMEYWLIMNWRKEDINI